MVYRVDSELKRTVCELVDAQVDERLDANSEFWNASADRLYQKAWYEVEARMGKETRVLKHVTWAGFLCISLLIVMLAFRYSVQMSSPEGRCADACLAVETVDENGCTCRGSR